MTVSSPPPIVVDLTWKGGMRFAARSEAAEFVLDGPGNTEPTPVQALACSLAACMGIDLVQVLTKGRHPLEALQAHLVGNRRGEAPKYFTEITLHFVVTGDIPPDAVERVLDGGRAFLRVGESIPQVQPFLALVGSRLGVVAGIQYQDVTTVFEVEPRILGEQIQLTVTPRLAFRSNQGAQTINFQELSTVVTVKPGEWVDLGGAVESTNEVNRQILSTRRNTGREDSRFLIRVDPQ